MGSGICLRCYSVIDFPNGISYIQTDSAARSRDEALGKSMKTLLNQRCLVDVERDESESGYDK